ncbi:MAG: hypothetical protein KGS47_11530 [Chloroflexi bacterium]|nr:hypothetical protein [Chloroflexota bacterium]
MNQRLALVLAAGLTVFAVVVVVGVMNYVNGIAAVAPDATATATVPASATASPTAPAIDPTVEAVLREREAAYRAALDDANARLSQANEEIRRANDAVAQAERDQQRMAAQVGTLVDERDAAIAEADAAVIRAEQQPIAPAPAPTPAATATPAWIPADQALAAISALAPAGRLQAPAELVRYEGTPAWELRLDVGLVYVDALSAAVLYNGIVQPTAAPAPAPAGPISADQAAQAALAYLGGGQVIGVDPWSDGRGAFYVVRLADRTRVTVDAASGLVVAIEVTRPGGGGDDERGDDGEHDAHDDEHRDGHGDEDAHDGQNEDDEGDD